MNSLIDLQTYAFTASELERVTETPLATVRSWKAREFVHRNAMVASRGGYALHTVAEIMILAELSKLGIGPKTVFGWTSSMAMHVVGNALNDPVAFDTADNWRAWVEDGQGRASPVRFGIVSSRGGIQVAHSLDEFLSRRASIEARQCCALLDYEAIGAVLRSRTARPLATVIVHDLVESAEGSFFVNRMTGKRVGDA